MAGALNRFCNQLCSVLASSVNANTFKGCTYPVHPTFTLLDLYFKILHVLSLSKGSFVNSGKLLFEDFSAGNRDSTVL